MNTLSPCQTSFALSVNAVRMFILVGLRASCGPHLVCLVTCDHHSMALVDKSVSDIRIGKKLRQGFRNFDYFCNQVSLFGLVKDCDERSREHSLDQTSSTHACGIRSL